MNASRDGKHMRGDEHGNSDHKGYENGSTRNHNAAWSTGIVTAHGKKINDNMSASCNADLIRQK